MSNGTQIFFRSDTTCCVRLKNGRFKKVALPKFYHRQFVRTSPKHYSQKSFTMVLQPTWTETRRWVYGERYIDRQGIGGGTGFWSNEDLYEPLSNPIDILIAKKLSMQDEKKEHELKIKTINKEIEHIDYALKLQPESRGLENGH